MLFVFYDCSLAGHRLGHRSTASAFCARSFADQTRNLRGWVQIPLAQAASVESAQLSIQFCLMDIIFVRPKCCRYGKFTTALHMSALHVRVRVWGAHAARAACPGGRQGNEPGRPRGVVFPGVFALLKFGPCSTWKSTVHGPASQRIRHRLTEPGIAGSSPAGVML